jgi:hypothetical protein
MYVFCNKNNNLDFFAQSSKFSSSKNTLAVFEPFGMLTDTINFLSKKK